MHKQLTVLTTCYNKGRVVGNLKEALEGQTMDQKLFQWWIMENSTDATTRGTRNLVHSWNEDWITVTDHNFTPDEREAKYAHPVLMNQALREWESEFFIHISDDDIPEPEFLETLAGFLRFNLDKQAAYVPMCQAMVHEGKFVTTIPQIPSACIVFTKHIDPVGILDGNTVMFRTEALRELGDPWREGWDDAELCDGLMLNDFVKLYNIWPAATHPMFTHYILASSMTLRAANEDTKSLRRGIIA